MKKFGWTFALTLLTAMLFAQVDPNRTVFIVNGEEVKGQEYYRRMETLPGVGKRMGASWLELPPGLLTIEQLITERLTLQLAKERGVYPPNAEVQDEMNRRLKEDPNLLKDWEDSGRTKDELLYQIRVALAMFKIQTAGVTITDQQVKQQYNEAISRYTLPKRYDVSIIVVKTPEQQQVVDKELAAGKAFTEVAKTHSVEASKAVGGKLGIIAEGSFSDKGKEMLGSIKIGQATGWLETKEGGYAKFQLDDVIPSEVQPLTPELKESIRRDMMLQGGRLANPDISKQMAQMRAKAVIDIKDEDFAKVYQKFIEAYLKSAGITSGGTP